MTTAADSYIFDAADQKECHESERLEIEEEQKFSPSPPLALYRTHRFYIHILLFFEVSRLAIPFYLFFFRFPFVSVCVSCSHSMLSLQLDFSYRYCSFAFCPMHILRSNSDRDLSLKAARICCGRAQSVAACDFVLIYHWNRIWTNKNWRSDFFFVVVVAPLWKQFIETNNGMEMLLRYIYIYIHVYVYKIRAQKLFIRLVLYPSLCFRERTAELVYILHVWARLRCSSMWKVRFYTQWAKENIAPLHYIEH